MLRNVFVYKIQCELSFPKSTRKISGLLRNARQLPVVLKAQLVSALHRGSSPQYACVRIYIIVFQTLFVCLSLVWVPESRVNRSSGVLGGGELYSGGGDVRKGAVFRNLRLFGQRCSV